MGRVAEQVAALEAQAAGAKPRFVVVGLGPHNFRIGEWFADCGYYSVNEHFGKWEDSVAANAALVSLGLAGEVSR